MPAQMGTAADLPWPHPRLLRLWLWTARDGGIPEASLTPSLLETQDYGIRQEKHNLGTYLTLCPERVSPSCGMRNRSQHSGHLPYTKKLGAILWEERHFNGNHSS